MLDVCYLGAHFDHQVPWNRVRFTHGFGTRAANFDMKSSGSKMVGCAITIGRL